jgi:diguanylate cyclase (GGDEF)-like protein
MLGRRFSAWPGRLRAHLGSRVGRRLCVLFVVAAVVPVLLMGAVSFLHSADALREQNDQALAASARALGGSVLDRLAWTESLLAVAAGGRDPAARLSPRVGQELSGFALFDRRGRPLAQVAAPDLLERLEPARFPSGDEGRRTTLFAGSEFGATILVHAVAAPGEVGFVAAVLSPAFLFDLRPAPPDWRLCVAAGNGERLFCSQAVADEALWRLSKLEPAGERLADFEQGGVVLRAGIVRIDVGRYFNGPTLTAVAAGPRAPLPGIFDAFGPISILVLIASIALALALSVEQVRPILEALQGLRAGTRRVAARDFGTPVPIDRNDEFGQMAHAFNAMTDQLGLHFRTLHALSVIDRTILTNVDVHQVTELALSCIQEIAGVRSVGIGITGAISRRRTHVYIRTAEDKTIREELPDPFVLPPEDPAIGRWSATTSLPERFREVMAAQGAQCFHLLPISRAERTWGVVVLGHDRELPLNSDQTLGLAGAIDRLAVALSSVARDKQLYEQAHYDSLTQLPNRHYLMIMLKQLLTQAKRERRPLAVLYIDLDRFKRTNDTLGHAAGDVMLRLAAGRIRRAVRNADIVARLGGDEFTVLLPNLKNANDAGRIARTLIASLNEPFDIDGHIMYAGGSVGIAMYPNDGDSAAELLKKADTALYLAKDRGRGRYAFFEEQMNVDASARATIDRELREALARGEFRLHYQPQIDLTSGEVCAVEALLRWQHPHRGLLAPAAFIEYAEDSGLIEAVGSWVLREACEQHRRWADSGLVLPRISINVSALQLRDRMFAATVEGALASSTTAPSNLEIEVTESLFLDAGPDAVATLERLREKGVEIAVDDFGTGYSSFAYVKQLPARVLKLDRSFIIDVVNNHEASIIAGAIIEMAHALGKTVVAEGVETEQQAQFLRRLRCARAQGFVFSAALPPEQIPAYVRGRQTCNAAAPSRSGPLLLAQPEPEAAPA